MAQIRLDTGLPRGLPFTFSVELFVIPLSTSCIVLYTKHISTDLEYHLLAVSDFLGDKVIRGLESVLLEPASGPTRFPFDEAPAFVLGQFGRQPDWQCREVHVFTTFRFDTTP